MSILRVLNAERLKYRRISTLPLALGIPALITTIGWLVLRYTTSTDKLEVLVGTMLGSWIVILSMIIAILASQAVALENTHLKHILVQPVRRSEVYITKILAVAVLIFLSSLVLIGGFALVATAAGGLTSASLINFTKTVGLIYVGSLPLIALTVGLAFRLRSAATLGFVLLGGVFTSYAMRHEIAWKFLPWSYPSALIYTASFPPQTVYLAIVVSFSVFLLLGLLAFAYQEPR